MQGQPYDFLGISHHVAKLRKELNRTVLHQETCPECGRTMVNLYRHGHVWKCRQCWEQPNTERSEPQTKLHARKRTVNMVCFLVYFNS